MKKTICFVLFSILFLCAAACEGQELEAWSKSHPGLSTAVVHSVTKAPWIDGKLDPVYTEHAKPLSFMFMHGYPGTPGCPTRVWMISDTDNLYIFARCESPLPEKVIANKTQRDSGVWQDEVFEIFIDPANERKPGKYFQITVNAKGVTEDSMFRKISWNPELTVQTSIEGAKAWTMEMKLPFKELALDPETMPRLWAFNLSRTMRHPEDPETFEDTAWSPTHAVSPHYPKYFGCVYIEPGKPKPENKDEIAVTGIKAFSRKGQTFITWTDAEPEKPGVLYRYNVYQSEQPITQKNLSQAKPAIKGLMNNSAKIFNEVWKEKDYAQPRFPNYTLEHGTPPLPHNTGLAVVTIEKDGRSYYAVAATDKTGNPVTKIISGQNSLTKPVDERAAPIQPILRASAKESSPYCHFTGKKNLPLLLYLHPLSGNIAGYGDIYDFFGRPEWGWRQGLPGVFAVKERRGFRGPYLNVESNSVAPTPDGHQLTTWWFGYACVPQWADHKEPKAYPFTERKLDWLLNWAIDTYKADRKRIYCMGTSMGGWGSAAYALRRPDIFAAVYPRLPLFRRPGVPVIGKISGSGSENIMADSKQTFSERMDSVALASKQHTDLPFVAWCIGRRDNHGPWKQQPDMVKALTETRRGFAFAWNNGGHSEGVAPFSRLMRYYPPERFRLDLSYPAFTNSSINDNLGNGDPKDGDMEGGINMGFFWEDPVENKDQWRVSIRNELAKKSMSVDVTPRRAQKFKLKPGQKAEWSVSTGGKGLLTADQWGIITVTDIKIKPEGTTVITIRKK